MNQQAIFLKSHVGAGDCFAAHLVLALAHGLSLEEAAMIAHSAGRIYVQHPHGRPPWPHEIKKDLDPAGGKVIRSGDLTALRQSIPGRIAFTCGCFDILHPGHVNLLTKAREFGDVLVVGINDDQSVKSLKGPARPIMSLDGRMKMLAALGCVDWIVPFGGTAPMEVMRELQPDVFAKGDDADRDKSCDHYASEVKLVPMLAGWSTTATLGKIRGMV
jgi:D-beta-D-heptose 7-phosphate kinase/D-beta-D-heptose 1-phosphate adenosyltransferase